MFENRSNRNRARHASGRKRSTTLNNAGRAALLLLVLAALGAAGPGPAHADPGPCGGTCAPPPPPKPPPNDPRLCQDCNSGATKPNQRYVTVYRSTRAYSTPYLNALKSKRLPAAIYPATCEANSGSRGRYSNPWWSRLRDGYWVNNGDLKGPAKMGIGDCKAVPPNDMVRTPRGGRQGCDDCKPPAPPPPRGGRRGCDDCTARPVKPYRAGENLNLIRLANGKYQTSICTSGFVLQLPAAPVGLTAGHCSQFPAFGGTQNAAPVRVTGLRSEPKTRFGYIVANAYQQGGPDALIFLLGSEVPSAVQEIAQGSGAALIVDGKVDTKDQTNGVRVCYTGRGSAGCGAIVGDVRKDDRRLICVHTRRIPGGDSGGPVFLKPRNGHTRAVGILTGERLNPRRLRHEMCYTPIDTILQRFGATFPTGTSPIRAGVPA